ncbi:hypothetical protein ZIOFF_059658 [Zingiber officinale]|uniref:Uncharacterized protein n=1 Tax=Zingiber officinale TaxID=94328 RepID=A0A8J5KMV3_ZINOF|nr:hypothetical protein ZIOFF_059658 [Zingiber officinale]
MRLISLANYELAWFHSPKRKTYLGKPIRLDLKTYCWIWPLGVGLPPSFQCRSAITGKFPSSSLAKNLFSDVYNLFFFSINLPVLARVSAPV